MDIDREIYFVRHGETDWNKLGLGQGSRNDIPLNNNGIKQAEITGKYFRDYRIDDKNFDLVLCSPMLRAKKTAEIICNKVGFDLNKIKFFDELVENDQGLISIGKTDEELKKDKFYDDYFKFREKVDKIKDPIESKMFFMNNVSKVSAIEKKYKLESKKKLMTRCKKIIDFIKKSKFKKILIVSHGGTVVNGFLCLLFNIIKIKGDYTYGSNCHITYVTQKKNKFNLITIPNTLHFAIYN
jgi:broad specificity phosphatase PhoE